MGYYSKYTDRMDIHVEEYRNTILIQQKWKYNWLNQVGTSPWTYLEKKEFHHQADMLIWNSWGGHFKLKVRGTSDFVKNHGLNIFTVNFDLKWVLSSTHWDVDVTKLPVGYSGNPTSSVSWANRRINLDTKDVLMRNRSGRGQSYNQYPVVHEYGHSVGNSIYATTGMHGDEYKSTSLFYADKISVMNIGNQLRQRHLDYLISELNQMIPNTEFYVYSLN